MRISSTEQFKTILLHSEFYFFHRYGVPVYADKALCWKRIPQPVLRRDRHIEPQVSYYRKAIVVLVFSLQDYHVRRVLPVLGVPGSYDPGFSVVTPTEVSESQ